MVWPPAPNRNEFRLVIRKQDRGQVLAAEELIWSRADDCQVIEFSPRQLVAEGGEGEFDLFLLRGDDRLLEQDFEID